MGDVTVALTGVVQHFESLHAIRLTHVTDSIVDTRRMKGNMAALRNGTIISRSYLTII